ncbi:MAG: hypothetical protein QM621_10695 [Aeromicrobium sp.]|uniref:hypothetical protein n=1 Tax=Aeromicrobium sp. TaxID=1871063 RepID=UPI0039E5CCD9
MSLVACAAVEGEPDIVGVWSPDDGTGVKTINDNGSCSGMYYNQGQPLDIGGVATCSLSDGTSGEHVMVVRQPPNERTYRVEFDGDDTMVLKDDSGGVIVTLTRQ